MTISIIIPVYNEENFIKELLIRVNNIKNLRKEIIVINDKSTDNTASILENECKSLYSKLIITQPIELDCGKIIKDFPLAYETYVA